MANADIMRFNCLSTIIIIILFVTFDKIVTAVVVFVKCLSSHVSQILETFLHVLQLISTSEQGVQALGSTYKSPLIYFSVFVINVNFE